METEVKANIFALPEDSPYKGVMLALYPSPEVAQQIAAMTGVQTPAEELHVTLSYCESVSAMSDEQVAGAVLVAKQAGEMMSPLTGAINGLGRFNASQSSDGKDVIYAVIDVPGLDMLRNEVLAQLNYVGVEVSRSHGYNPHMTLAYIDAGSDSPIVTMPTMPLSFDKISIAVGGKRTKYTLNGNYNKSTDSDPNTLLAFGGHVKALGDGRVGGYLVRYGDPENTDLEGDYFTPSTDFDIDWSDAAKSATYYNHGLDPVLKKRKLTTGTLKRDDVGVWVEAQLQMRDEYEKAIYRMAEQNKLGWSSGTAPHLVERKAVDGANEITRWPLGLDASLTPTPAEYRNAVVSLKSWQEHGPQIELSTGATPDMIEVKTETEDVETAQPEDARPASATVTEPVEATTAVSQPELTQHEVTTMNEEQKKAPVIDVATVAAQAAQQAVAAVMAQFTAVNDAVKTIGERVKAIETQPINETPVNVPTEVKTVNTNLKTKPGDSETKAYAYFLRTGDAGALGKAMKASNDTDMNVGTAADGGYAVPTGHYQGIIARLDEAALYRTLGVQVMPGQGTTVNVPVDNEADGEFVSTAEAAAFDRDAPAINQVAMTLVKYTKKVELSYELLQDEDSRLMVFLDDFVGRGMAKTHNSLLLTEARANGTAALTLDAAAAIGAAEIPELMYKLPAEYDGGAVWVMKRASEGYLRGFTGNNFQFVPTPQGTLGGSNTLFGKPVYNSEYASAIAASAKSLIYGNFRYMGMRLAPDITVLRDPYSKAGNGQIVLHYYFRTVYKVLQAEAIVYATHPSA